MRGATLRKREREGLRWVALTARRQFDELRMRWGKAEAEGILRALALVELLSTGAAVVRADKPRTLTITLTEQQHAALAVLDAEGAEQALQTLVTAAVDGVQRPGSWERAWLLQAFGPDFCQRLEPCPEHPHHARPRGTL